MAQSLLKFVAIWFAAMLLAGAVFGFTTGAADTLNPSVSTDLTQQCSQTAGGFSDNRQAECLSRVQRDLASLAETTSSNLLFWHAITGILVLLVGVIFVIQIVQRDAVASGIPAFRSMRSPWFIHMLTVAIIGVVMGLLAYFVPFFGPWGALMSPAYGWGIPAAMVILWCLVFWLGTVIATPAKMKPSIPGA